MLRNDDEWLSIIDTFFSSAMDGNWNTPLEKFAEATGSWSGELIGLGTASAVSFNWVTGIGPEWKEDFVASGGADLNLNPYARAAFHIPELHVVQSGELLTREDWRNNSFINFHITRYDVRHVCLTPLLKQCDGLMVGLAVMRSTSQGEITPQQRKVFASLSQHLRAAARMQIALESRGAQLMAGTLEMLSLAAFVCNRAGVVKAMTPDAEGLVSAGASLHLRQGMLGATNPADARKLDDAIRRAADGLLRPGTPLASTVLIHGNTAVPLLLEIYSLPRREYSFGFSPRVLVVARGTQRDPNRTKGLLQMVYGLTAAEADVALRLASGQSPATVATARKATVSTVRAQMRAIYAKLHIHHLSELAARINQLR